MDRERTESTQETTALAWIREGIGRSPTRREQFLRDLRRGAKAGLYKALRAAAREFPERSLRQLYRELVPGLLAHFSEQARGAGLSGDDLKLFVGAYKKAFETVGREFGFRK